MNKYKQAFNGWMDSLHESEHCSEDLKVLMELVEKATPKKPLEVYESFLDLDLFGECPVCGEWCSSTMNYCPKCGQALDWSEEDVNN